MAIIREMLFARDEKDREHARMAMADAFESLGDDEAVAYLREGKQLLVVYYGEEEKASDSALSVQTFLKNRGHADTYHGEEAKQLVRRICDIDRGRPTVYADYDKAYDELIDEYVNDEVCPECGHSDSWSGDNGWCADNGLCCECQDMVGPCGCEACEHHKENHG